jgi:divalent metal cation (Fe/Co/Zn/Cd) transporter
MGTHPHPTPAREQYLYRIAFLLAIFTIVYNIVEGLVSTWFGFSDESLTLFGFGVDSFIEAISGFGIAQMIIRIRKHHTEKRSGFERTALRITGTAFYILTAGLVISGIYNLYTGHEPESTFWGVVISLLSILVMLVLIHYKTKTGKELDSDAILADVSCTKVCVYMSVILLLSSAIYQLTGFGYIDVLGTFGLAWFSWREGKESFEKSNSDKYCACEH